LGESVITQLLEMAKNNPNLFHHQAVHNEVLRQLLDSAQMANTYRSKDNMWEREVDFD
jgi:hypothetical protein